MTLPEIYATGNAGSLPPGTLSLTLSRCFSNNGATVGNLPREDIVEDRVFEKESQPLRLLAGMIHAKVGFRNSATS